MTFLSVSNPLRTSAGWSRCFERAPVGTASGFGTSAASIAAATGNPNIPKAGFEKLLVYVPLRQRIEVKESREFDRVSGIRTVRIFPEELASRASELVLSFRTSMIPEVERARCLNGACAVWAMWPGYLERPGRLRDLVRDPLCRACGCHASSVVDHIVKARQWVTQHQGSEESSFDETNLQGLCKRCHDLKTRRGE